MNAGSGDDGAVGGIAKRSEASSFGGDLEGDGEDSEVGAFFYPVQQLISIAGSSDPAGRRELRDLEQRHGTKRKDFLAMNRVSQYAGLFLR